MISSNRRAGGSSFRRPAYLAIGAAVHSSTVKPSFTRQRTAPQDADGVFLIAFGRVAIITSLRAFDIFERRCGIE